MWGRLFRFLLLILLAPMIAAVTYEAVRYLREIVTIRGIMWFAAGAGAFVFFYLLFLRGRITFFEHLFHELRHAIMAWLFTGRLPSSMVIDPEGTSAVLVPSGGGCFTTLAPYLFPMLVLPFLALEMGLALLSALTGLQVPGVVDKGLDFLIGVTWAFHAILVIRQFAFWQDDIKKVGRVFSFVMIVFLNFFFLVAILTVVTNSYPEFWEFLKACWDTIKEFYVAAWEFLKYTVIPFLKDLWQRIFLMLCKECPRPTPTPRPGGK